MTRDEVLKEFYATPSVPGGATDRMADEIVRLRKERDQLLETKDAVFDNLFRTEEERDAIAERFTSACDMARQYAETYGIDRAGDNVFQTMRDDAERHRRILAALRAPSEAVKNAVFETWLMAGTDPFSTGMFRAAVAAAEREVASDNV